MAKCTLCGKKIKYNKYKIVDEKVYCNKCAELHDEGGRIAEKLEAKAAEIIEPTEKAKEELLRQGIHLLESHEDDE